MRIFSLTQQRNAENLTPELATELVIVSTTGASVGSKGNGPRAALRVFCVKMAKSDPYSSDEICREAAVLGENHHAAATCNVYIVGWFAEA